MGRSHTAGLMPRTKRRRERLFRLSHRGGNLCAAASALTQSQFPLNTRSTWSELSPSCCPEFTEPQNHRIVWVGRDFKDHLVPTPSGDAHCRSPSGAGLAVLATRGHTKSNERLAHFPVSIFFLLYYSESGKDLAGIAHSKGNVRCSIKHVQITKS